MADIVKHRGDFWSIEGADDSTAIAEDHTINSGVLDSVFFKPGGNSDVLVIKDGDADGPYILKVQVTSSTDIVDIHLDSARAKPFLDSSECNLTAGALVVFHHRCLNIG